MTTGGVVYLGGSLTWASEDARRIRSEVFSVFVAEGRAPSGDELAATLGLERNEVAVALRELHDAHAIVLTGAIVELERLYDLALPWLCTFPPHGVQNAQRSTRRPAPQQPTARAERTALRQIRPPRVGHRRIRQHVD